MNATRKASSNGMFAGKRVLIVFDTLELGGAERQGIHLAKYFAEVEKAQVEVWGFAGPGKASKLCDSLGIPWRVVPFRWNTSRFGLIKELFRFRLRLKNANPDVVLPYFMPPNLVCCALWRFTGAGASIWQQREEGRCRGPRRLEKLAVKSASAFIANASTGRLFLVEQLGVAPERVKLISNGVRLEPPQTDRAAWRQKLGLQESTLLACMVANLHRFKDHATLLKAWSRVLKTSPERQVAPVLLLAGRDGGTTDNLKALAYDMELGRSIRFLGSVDDISGLLGAVDLGVFSSGLEGCPNGVLECMASGLAVAATDIPGVREALGRDSFEHLAPVGDHEKLAGRISTLLADTALRTRVGQANQVRVKQEFSVDRMCQETIAVVKNALARGGTV